MNRRHDRKDLHLITGHKYLKNDPYHKLRTLPRMRYLTHLPTVIKASVDTYIQTQPIYANRCWFNSHKLHLHNPKINVEHGYYFPKRISEDKEYKNQKKRWELMYKYLETHNFIDGDTKKLIVYPNDALYPHMKHFRKGEGEFYETDEKLIYHYIDTLGILIMVYILILCAGFLRKKIMIRIGYTISIRIIVLTIRIGK